MPILIHIYSKAALSYRNCLFQWERIDEIIMRWSWTKDPGIFPQRLYPKFLEIGHLCPRGFGSFMSGAGSGGPKFGWKCPQNVYMLQKSLKIRNKFKKFIKNRQKNRGVEKSSIKSSTLQRILMLIYATDIVKIPALWAAIDLFGAPDRCIHWSR